MGVQVSAFLQHFEPITEKDTIQKININQYTQKQEFVSQKERNQNQCQD